MKGSITIDILKGGYVISNLNDNNVLTGEIITTKSKAIKIVKELLEKFENDSSVDQSSAE